MTGAVAIRREWGLRAVLALLALLSVAPLLAWVYRLGSFASWYWRVAVPALVLLVAACIWIALTPGRQPLHHAIVAGTIGGLLGAIAYDVVRIPAQAFGFRLLAPIDSYGVLLLNAVGSSGRAGFAGWFFHTTNGICFGIAYAVVAAGRKWWWGVLWAMVLETATVVSPFAALYGLRSRPITILFAYLAHIPYGFAIGKLAEDSGRTVAAARELAPRFATTILLVVGLVGLTLWQRPWSTPAALARGEAVAPGPSAIIHGNNRMSPMWVRVRVGGCAAIRNETANAITFAGSAIGPGATAKVCFDKAAVKRVKIANKDWSGGFVIVDPEA